MTQEELKELKKIIEAKLQLNSWPYPLDAVEGEIWIRAQREALNWILEMLP